MRRRFLININSKQYPNEIWYTNGSTTSPTVPASTAAFDANIMSNEYDVKKACWIITFDKDVTEIGEQAFYYCSSLTSITIPNSVTSIGEWAFYFCSNLTSVTIGDSVTTIGDYAFFHCESLTSVTIPDRVTTIGKYVFAECHSLTSMIIPDGVTEIGYYAFSHCRSLTSMTIPDGVTTIGEYAFGGCKGLTSVTIGDSVTTIGLRVFHGCPSLKEFKGKFAAADGRCLIMDNTLIAYANASGTTYTIPDSVREIRLDAFRHRENLASVTIPDSVTTIGAGAFEYCTSLKAVYCKRTTPPTGGEDMFYITAGGCKIYVPIGSGNAYKTASGWSSYASFIEEYDFS